MPSRWTTSLICLILLGTAQASIFGRLKDAVVGQRRTLDPNVPFGQPRHFVEVLKHAHAHVLKEWFDHPFTHTDAFIEAVGELRSDLEDDYEGVGLFEKYYCANLRFGSTRVYAEMQRWNGTRRLMSLEREWSCVVEGCAETMISKLPTPVDETMLARHLYALLDDASVAKQDFLLKLVASHHVSTSRKMEKVSVAIVQGNDRQVRSAIKVFLAQTLHPTMMLYPESFGHFFLVAAAHRGMVPILMAIIDRPQYASMFGLNLLERVVGHLHRANLRDPNVNEAFHLLILTIRPHVTDKQIQRLETATYFVSGALNQSIGDVVATKFIFELVIVHFHLEGVAGAEHGIGLIQSGSDVDELSYVRQLIEKGNNDPTAVRTMKFLLKDARLMRKIEASRQGIVDWALKFKSWAFLVHMLMHSDEMAYFVVSRALLDAANLSKATPFLDIVMANLKMKRYNAIMQASCRLANLDLFEFLISNPQRHLKTDLDVLGECLEWTANEGFSYLTTAIIRDVSLIRGNVGMLRQQIPLRFTPVPRVLESLREFRGAIVIHSVETPLKVSIDRQKSGWAQTMYTLKEAARSVDLRYMSVEFVGEVGLDYGGLFSEGLGLFYQIVFLENPYLSVFKDMSTGHTQVNDELEYEWMFEAAGRLLGLAFVSGRPTGFQFSPLIYRLFASKDMAAFEASVSLSDLRIVDPAVHKSMNDILAYGSADLEAMEMSFQAGEHDLLEGGEGIFVSEENKHKFVELYVNHILCGKFSRQYAALLSGFDFMLEGSRKYLTESEIKNRIEGRRVIDVDEWKQATHAINMSVELIAWFWEVVSDMNTDEQNQLFKYITAYDVLPSGGFRDLPQKFQLHGTQASTDNLPVAHTCFFTLDLPLYESKETLSQKLHQAMFETGFGLA